MNYMNEANAIAAAIRGTGSKPLKEVRNERRAAKQAEKQAAKANPVAEVQPKQPTEKQMEVYEFARAFFADNDQLPPLDFIAAHFGWHSRTAAQCSVDALIRHGLLERNACGKLRFARSHGSAA